MENLTGFIAEPPFCEGLETCYIDLLTSCASNVRAEKVFYLFRDESEANHFYLIWEGKVALESVKPTGPSLIVETVAKGELVGWSWLVPPYRWRFSARAVEPVRAIAVDGKCLRAKCEKNPHLDYELLKRTIEIVGQRLEASRLRMLDLYSADGQREPRFEFSG